LSAGVWYVAIDLQLFALTALGFAAVGALPWAIARQHAGGAGQALVVAGIAASLWGFNRVAALDMWAPYFFGAYGLGLLAHWAVQAPRAGGWVALMLVLVCTALAIDFRGRVLLALLTAL